MTPSANWSISTVTVFTKTGAQIAGLSAQVFEDNAGAPVLVQVNKGDHYVEIPWCEVEQITHA